MEKTFEELEISIKDNEYAHYISDHKTGIIRSFNEFGEELCNLLHVSEQSLKELVIVHDDSKYNEKEFEYYRKVFYPAEHEKSIDKEILMQYGFLLHENANPHHPEYWVYRDGNTTKPLVMPNIFIAEMILDWDSFHYKILKIMHLNFGKKKSLINLFIKIRLKQYRLLYISLIGKERRCINDYN